MHETRRLAEFVSGLRFEDLPQAAVEQACNLVLDDLGCCLAAWEVDSEKTRVASEYVASFGAKGEAHVVGARGLASRAPLAAFANGVLSNAADNDDTHKGALAHISSVVIPAALAMAQARRLSGREMLASVVAGYEVASRVGMAVMPSHYEKWHSTATNCTFGAGATAARALGLDADRTEMALGFAGTQAAGLNAFFESGDMTKSVHPGKSAMNGIMGAELAAIGGTAPPAILERNKGYLAAFTDAPRPEVLAAGLGTTWEILENGFKYYPSILASHAPIGATLELVERHDVKPADIARLTLETYRTVTTHFSNYDPHGSMAARISVPFCMAVAAVDRKLGQAQFRPDRVEDPVVRSVLVKTQVLADEALNKLYPKNFPARVTITLKDGTIHQTTWMVPKGDPQNPLSVPELEDKFRSNASGLLGDKGAERAVRLCRELPEAGAVDELMRLVALAG